MQTRVDHLVLRPNISVRGLCGLIGLAGSALSAALLAFGYADPEARLSASLLLVASIALGLFYGTTEVHATPHTLWLRRYGFTWWSVPMSEAGTTEGQGPDWRLIFVFNLRTGRRVGSINWWVLDHRELPGFTEFVDQAREAQGVTF